MNIFFSDTNIHIIQLKEFKIVTGKRKWSRGAQGMSSALKKYIDSMNGVSINFDKNFNQLSINFDKNFKILILKLTRKKLNTIEPLRSVIPEFEFGSATCQLCDFCQKLSIIQPQFHLLSHVDESCFRVMIIAHTVRPGIKQYKGGNSLCFPDCRLGYMSITPLTAIPEPWRMDFCNLTIINVGQVCEALNDQPDSICFCPSLECNLPKVRDQYVFFRSA